MEDWLWNSFVLFCHTSRYVELNGSNGSCFVIMCIYLDTSILIFNIMFYYIIIIRDLSNTLFTFWQKKQTKWMFTFYGYTDV